MISPKGCATFKCKVDGRYRKIHFEIIDNAPTSLLSANACAALNLVTFNEQLVCHVNCDPSPTTKEQVLQEYADVFKGLKKLPGMYSIETDPKVKAVQNN